jgi:hypothetical protein
LPKRLESDKAGRSRDFKDRKIGVTKAWRLRSWEDGRAAGIDLAISIINSTSDCKIKKYPDQVGDTLYPSGYFWNH